MTASPVRRVVLRNGVGIEDPLRVVLGFLKAPGRFDVSDPLRPASFGEPDLRLANRGGARISAAQIAAILERPAWGRRAHRLEPDPRTAPVVRWIFAQRLAGHSVARIARALNEAGVPCPSAADPVRNTHRSGTSWTLGTVTTILENPRYTGRQVWNRQRTDTELADPANVTLGHKSVQRWNLPDGWVISSRPAHPALVSEDDFIAAQGINAARGPVPQDELVLRRYLLAGLLACGLCGAADGISVVQRPARVPVPARAHQCDGARPGPPEEHLHPRGQAAAAPARPAPPAHQPAVRARRRTRAGADVRSTVSPAEVIGYLREHEITLTWNPAVAALQARATQTAKTVTVTGR